MPLGNRPFRAARRPTAGRSWLSDITLAWLAVNPTFRGPAFDAAADPDLLDDVNAALADLSAVDTPPWVRGAPGVLVPSYIYPAAVYTNTVYDALIATIKIYRSIPFAVIMNVTNGPGTVVDANFTVAIKRLQGAGAHVFAYVRLNYGAQTLAQIQADLDGWKALYPGVQHIFFDEFPYQATTTNKALLTAALQYARSLGYRWTIGNPGALAESAWYDARYVDTLIVTEGASYPTEAVLRGNFGGGHSDYPQGSRGAIVYAQTLDTAQVAMMTKYLGLICVTNDVLPNPFDALPDEGPLAAAILAASSGLPASGETGVRPVSPLIGTSFFDTTLGREVKWDGAQWLSIASLFDIPGGTQKAFQDVSSAASVTITGSRVYLRAGCDGAQLTLPQYYSPVPSVGIDFIWDAGATGTVTLLRQGGATIDTVAADLVLNAQVNRRFRTNGSNWETTLLPVLGGYTRTQTDTFAASYTPDPTSVEGHEITLTANITVNNVATPKAGQLLTLIFTQDATGSRTVTWGSAYKIRSGFTISATASSVSSACFIYTAAGAWVQL